MYYVYVLVFNMNNLITFCKNDCSPGASVMQLITIATSNMSPYITFVDVEFPHDGQHAKREHAA